METTTTSTTEPAAGDPGDALLAEMAGPSQTTLDDDYRQRLETRNSDDNLKWLEDQVGPLVDEPEPPAGAGILEGAGKVAKDIGGGLIEAPKQAVSGAIDAVGEAWDLVDQAATWLNQNVADTRLGTLMGDKMAPPQAGEVGQVPNPIGPAETVTGGFVHSIAQFLTGFAGAGKVTGIKNSLPGVFGKSALADFAAFDGQEANLANLIQQFPTLQNPVTEFLANDAETPEMVGRLQNALTGLGAGMMMEPVIKLLRGLRAARKAKELTGEADYASAAKRLAEAGPDDPTLGAPANPVQKITEALGDPNAPLVQVQDEVFPTGDAYAAKALDKTTMLERPDSPEHLSFDQFKQAVQNGKIGPSNDPDFARIPRDKVSVRDDRSPAAIKQLDDWRASPEYDELKNLLQKKSSGQAYDVARLDALSATMQRLSMAVQDRVALDIDQGLNLGYSRDDIARFVAHHHALATDQAYRAAAIEHASGRGPEPRLSSENIEQAYRRMKAMNKTTDASAAKANVVRAYHGTGEALTGGVFDPSKIGKNAIDDGAGVFFTSRPNEAEFWAKEFGGNNPNIVAVDIEFKRPLIVDSGGEVPTYFWYKNKDAIRSKVKSGNYDGIIINGPDFVDGTPHKTYIALKGANVRSALDGADMLAGGTMPPAAAVDGGGALTPPQGPPGATGGAGGMPPRPPGGARLDFGPRQVYVNLARINAPDDIKAVITQTADAFGDDIAKAQRGVRSNAETIAAAGDQNAWDLLQGKRKPGAPLIYTAEEQLVLRNLWVQSGTKLKELARAASEGGPAELVAFRRMIETHRMIQNEVIGIRTETARALQQWRIPAGGNKEMERQLADMLANGGEEVSRDMAAKVAALADHPNGGPALESFVDRLGKGTQLTVDVIREYWINSILSGPKTHAVNMVSNSAVFFQSLGERALAGQLGDLVNPVYGVKPGEASAMLYGALEAQKDAWKAAAHAFRTGETGMGRTKTLEAGRKRAMSAESFGVSSDSILGRGLDYAGGFINIPGRALTAADDYFKMINYRAQIHALSLRKASEEIERGIIPRDGLKARIAELVDDPPESFRVAANDYAAYNTFTNGAGPVAQAAMKVRDTVPGGWLAMPFVNTPANLFTFAFERSPAALMMKNRFWAEVQAGGARRDMALAKMGLGTMAFTAAFDLAVNGNITGGGPSGDKAAGQRQALSRVGWQPYSIRVQTGTEPDGKPTYRYFAYNRFDPVGTLFANAADLGEYVMNAGDGRIETRDAAELMAMMVFGTAENLKDKAFFRGFADAVAAVNNPERYGERWLQNAAGGFIPTAVKEVARAVDPVSRETTDLVSSLKNRTPGLSSDLPPRLDFWGKPLEYKSGLGTAYDAFSPVYSKGTAGKMDEVEKAFFELKYFPTHPASVQIGGQYVSLRNMPEIENRLVELTNSTAATLAAENADALLASGGRAALRRLEARGDMTLRQAMTDTIRSIEYQEAAPEERQDMLSDVLSDYRRAAKQQVLREFPRLQEIRESIPARGTGAQLPY